MQQEHEPYLLKENVLEIVVSRLMEGIFIAEMRATIQGNPNCHGKVEIGRFAVEYERISQAVENPFPGGENVTFGVLLQA